LVPELFQNILSGLLPLNVLVTGASGFVGQHLCHTLAQQGCTVRGLVRDPSRLSSALRDSIQPVKITGLDDTATIAAALVGIDVVIHLAARVHAMDDTQAQDAEYERVNHQGSMQLVRMAAAAGVRRLLFLSSIKVNGEERAAPYSLTDIPNPQDSYSRSKYAAESGLLAFAENSQLEVVVVRPPLVYGKGVKANFAQLIHWVVQGVPLPLASVKNQRSLVSVVNLVDLLQVCMTHPKACGQVFLVADDEVVSTTRLIQNIAQAYSVNARLFYCPQWLLRVIAKLLGRASSADRLLGSLSVDISATKQCLDWHPPVTMMQTLVEMANAEGRNK